MPKSDRRSSDWLEQLLVSLLDMPTQVPSGETSLPPGNPRIVEAVDRLAHEWVADLGPEEVRRHPMGDLAARFGPPSDDGLLIQTYIVSQHANLMDDPNAGSIVDGTAYQHAGLVAVGPGATQNKGPIASAFAAVRAVESTLRSPVWLTINTEGESSHGGSRRILDDLEVKAAHGLIAFGTDLRVSLGNRGRVDIELVVRGKTSHSSQPWLGVNPILGAVEVVRVLQDVDLPPDHEVLGPASLTPYTLTCFPIAPHTIPMEVGLVVDRRLLPGERADTAVATIKDFVESSRGDVTVTAGASMLPAEVDARSAIVRALSQGIQEARGLEAETFWSANTFDAGYGCAKGIPTVMFGPGKRGFSGEGLVGADAVGVDDCRIAAAAIARCISTLCT